MKRAIVTGVTGQDGSYLAEFLLAKGYEVYGMVRRSSVFNTERIDDLISNSHTEGVRRKGSFFRVYGDLTDASAMARLVRSVKPDEIYNLAAQSHVRVSFDIPEYTCDVDALGTLRLLESIRDSGVETKFYQASSSEMYGAVKETPQNEETPFNPQSPYACAKVFSYWITRDYRRSYGMFACNGILFNHESPRRGKTFVTRKITRGLGRIKLGVDDCLYLGNLDARRDWGYAGEYVEAMWKMMQQDAADDYVIASGETHTVREFVEAACSCLEIDLIWKGAGVEEAGIDRQSGKTIIRIDPYFFRPSEVDLLLGDPSKAKKVLDWQSRTTFRQLVEMMVKYDLAHEGQKAQFQMHGGEML